MNKCPGCGQILPDGFDKQLCEKCFKLKHYGKLIDNDNYASNEDLLKKINASNKDTFFLCDLMMISNAVLKLYQNINVKKHFVVTKIDVIPKNVSLDSVRINIQKVFNVKPIFISVKNNYGIKDFEKLLEEYKTVNFVGPTSSGKSTLINYLTNSDITVSEHANTTKDLLKIENSKFEITDYPGFMFDGFNEASKKAGYIRPKSLFLKKNYALEIDNKIIYCDKDINLTLFIPKNIIYRTYKIRKDCLHRLDVSRENELCLLGKGIIYFKKACQLFINDLSNVEVRESILVSHEQN